MVLEYFHRKLAEKGRLLHFTLSLASLACSVSCSRQIKLLFFFFLPPMQITKKNFKKIRGSETESVKSSAPFMTQQGQTSWVRIRNSKKTEWWNSSTFKLIVLLSSCLAYDRIPYNVPTPECSEDIIKSSVTQSINSRCQVNHFFSNQTGKHLRAWNMAPIVSLCVYPPIALEKGYWQAGGGEFWEGMLSWECQECPALFTAQAGSHLQVRELSPGLAPPLPYAPRPHYKGVKLRGDLIRSSLHHRQSPLACQAGLLIH